MDKLTAMRGFVEIVDRGSLTAAATALDRSLPTMVRNLAALEAELGVRLLRRTTRRMSLTPEGSAYLERCRRILADIEEAEAALDPGQREPRGRLRMTAPVRFGEMQVAPAVVEFLGRFPRVQVELLLLDRVADLVDEGIDLALRIGHLADSSLVAVPVGQVRRVVCASPALLQATGIPDRPEALAGHPCVAFRGIAPGDRWRFREGEREVPVEVGGGFACNQVTAALEACAAGLGFGMFLSYQVEPAVREGRLQVVLREFEPPPLPVSLVHADARLVSHRLRTFLDWMTRRLRGRPELQQPLP